MNHAATAKAVTGSAALCLSYLFGAMDFALQFLLLIMVGDYVSGMAKAFKKRKFDYTIGAWGIAKKIGILFLIAAAVRLDYMMGADGVIRLVAIYGYIGNESASCLKNLTAIGVYIPPMLAKYFSDLEDSPTKRRA